MFNMILKILRDIDRLVFIGFLFRFNWYFVILKSIVSILLERVDCNFIRRMVIYVFLFLFFDELIYVIVEIIF